MQSGTRHLRARLQGEEERWVRAGAGEQARFGPRPACHRAGWVGRSSAGPCPRGEAKVVAGPRPGQTPRDADSARPPAWPRRAPRTPAVQLSPGASVPSRRAIFACLELAAGLELGRRLEVEFVGSGSWGDAEGWESSAAELPLRPWAGDGRCETSNGLSASRGRWFETSTRSPWGNRAPGPSHTNGSELLGTLGYLANPSSPAPDFLFLRF